MASAVAAGGAQPTVIAPAPYADRLLRALDRYFVGCPNKWTPPPPQAEQQQGPEL